MKVKEITLDCGTFLIYEDYMVGTIFEAQILMKSVNINFGIFVKQILKTAVLDTSQTGYIRILLILQFILIPAKSLKNLKQ